MIRIPDKHQPRERFISRAELDKLSKAETRPQGQQILVDELGGVVFRPKISNHARIINGPGQLGEFWELEMSAGPTRVITNGQWFTINNKAGADAAEILIYDQIGKDWWSGEGVGAKDFVEALQKLDSTKTRALDVHINSPGGNVYDGLAIATNLREWKGKVNTFNDGLAASIASVILLASANGGKVHASKASSTMIHRASTVAIGTVDDMQRAISALEAAEKNILAAYKARAPMRTDQELSDAMAKETWFTGPEAKDFGFVDEVTDTAPVSNSFDLSSFKRVPEAFRKLTNSAAQGGGQSQHTTDHMDKAQIIALLKEHGIEVEATSTIEQLSANLKEVLAKAKAKPEPQKQAADGLDVKELSATLKRITDERDAERKARVSAAVNKCVEDRRIVAAQAAFWIEQAVKDEAILAQLQAMPQQLPAEPLNAGPTIEVTASLKDIGKHVARVGDEISKDILNDQGARASQKAMARATLIRQNLKRIGEVWNEGTNTIDSTLQQDVIMDMILRAFRRVLLPVSNFATIFSNVPLRGTAKVQVPYLALDATTPTDWNGANGYVAGDTTNDNKEITVDKRKYLGISYTSTELARQPFLMVEEQMGLKGESLAFAVWKDIWSIVKAAGFGLADGSAVGAGIATWPQAVNAMDSNKIIDLQSIADSLNWPTAGRLLFVNTPYDNALKKDTAFKNALAFGGSEVLRQGMIPNILGFNYATNVNLQDNGENLAGVIAQKNAILVATSPIAPTPEVLRDGTIYSIAVDPETGIAVEYRSFGDSQKDKSLKFIESNYGYAAGVAANLKRLTTA